MIELKFKPRPLMSYCSESAWLHYDTPEVKTIEHSVVRTCREKIQKMDVPWPLLTAGLIFVVVGIAVIFKPAILVWLLGAALVLFGAVLVGLFVFLRRIKARVHPQY